MFRKILLTEEMRNNILNEEGEYITKIGNPNHIMVLTNKDKLYGVGYNYFGQLGLRDYDNRYNFTFVMDNIKEVICGWDHTMIIDMDNKLYGTGSNVYGQLGLGDNNNRNNFTCIINNVEKIN